MPRSPQLMPNALPLTVAAMVFCSCPAAADQGSLAAKLANPVASLISVPFQNNFDMGGGSSGNAFRYTLNIQPVIPLTLSPEWNLIVRTILPISYTERVYADHRGGLGDITQSFFFSPSEPVNGLTWGAGPVFLYPSATDGLGQRQWGGGATAVVLQQSGPWIYGALANHIWSFGGTPEGQRDVNATFLQPFVSYLFPTQTTLSLNTETTYDWSRQQWTIPINVSISQLFTVQQQAMQLSVGGRYYAETPPGGPRWGARVSLTLVYPR